MSYPFAAEDLLRQHRRDIESLTMRARLVELAKCCKPSRVRALFARFGSSVSPAPCCA